MLTQTLRTLPHTVIALLALDTTFPFVVDFYKFTSLRLNTIIVGKM